MAMLQQEFNSRKYNLHGLLTRVNELVFKRCPSVQEAAVYKATQDRIIEEVFEGRSLDKICGDAEMPSVSTVRRFLGGTSPDQVAFRESFERAHDIRMRMLLEDIIELVDHPSPIWVERRNDNGEPYMARDRDALRRDKLRLAAMQREVERLERRRIRAAERLDAPVKYVITEVNYMDMPEEYRLGCRRHPNEPPRSSD